MSEGSLDADVFGEALLGTAAGTVIGSVVADTLVAPLVAGLVDALAPDAPPAPAAAPPTIAPVQAVPQHAPHAPGWLVQAIYTITPAWDHDPGPAWAAGSHQAGHPALPHHDASCSFHHCGPTDQGPGPCCQ